MHLSLAQDPEAFSKHMFFPRFLIIQITHPVNALGGTANQAATISVWAEILE